MTFGPSTTNAALAKALEALSKRIGDTLTPDERDALDEAWERIGERPDEEDEEDDDDAAGSDEPAGEISR